MIDTRTIKDTSGKTELCKTFAYSVILSYEIESGKQIKEVERSIEKENEYIVKFTDDTIFVFETENLVGHVEIDGGELNVFVGNNLLKQVETGKVYGSSVVDLIAGYKDGKPYSRFTYSEIGGDAL